MRGGRMGGCGVCAAYTLQRLWLALLPQHLRWKTMMKVGLICRGPLGFNAAGSGLAWSSGRRCPET